MPLKSRASTDSEANTIDQATIRREGLNNLFVKLRSTGSICATPCYGENTGKKRRDTALETLQENRPRVTYERFPGCWFLHAGKAWPVKDCPMNVLKSALRNLIIDESARELLSECTDLDLITRWYLCCEASTLRLFESKEHAMQALKAVHVH